MSHINTNKLTWKLSDKEWKLGTPHQISISVAVDYLQMLRKAWNNPANAPQSYAGCQWLDLKLG